MLENVKQWPFSIITRNLKWVIIILLQLGLGLICISLPWYTILTVFSLCCVIILLYIRFLWVAYVLVFLTPQIAERKPCFLFPKMGNEVIPLLLVVTSIAALLFMIRKSVKIDTSDSRKNQLSVPIILLVCYSILSIFWSPVSATNNLVYILILILNVTAFFLIFRVIDNEILHRQLMWCLIFSGIALSIQTIISPYLPLPDYKITIIEGLYLDLGLRKEMGSRCLGLYSDSVHTSAVLACLNMVAGGLLLVEKRRSRVLFLVGSICLFSMAMFLTQTRVGQWSLVAMILMFLFLSSRLRIRFFRAALIITLVFCSIFIASYKLSQSMFPSSVKSGRDVRLVTLGAEAKYGSVGTRVMYWRKGFDALREASLTLIGLGAGGYRGYHPELNFPHNIYFGLFFDYGLMAVVFVCYTIITLVSEFNKLVKHQKTYLQNMALSFGVILFGIGLMSFTFFSYYFPFVWLFLGIAYSTFSLARRELENKAMLAHEESIVNGI